MSEAPDAIVARIQKLLALAANNPNEHEASAAMAKAQEMLETYNLDLSMIGKTATGRPRKDQKQKGGLYGWQRALWESVAKLNFCTYWSIKGLQRGSTYEHRILGSHANVVSTEVMANYLQQAIERLAQAWAKEQGYQSVFVRDAIAYREGMARRICERLEAKRADKIREAKAKREEEAARAKHPGYAGTGTALTILDVVESEEDLNTDYLCGLEPGTTSARRREREARQAAAQADYERRQQAQREWDLEHPEEAAARDKKQREENEEWLRQYYAKLEKNKSRLRSRSSSSGPRYRKPTPEEERAALPAFADGYYKANDVNLDEQVDAEKRRKVK